MGLLPQENGAGFRAGRLDAWFTALAQEGCLEEAGARLAHLCPQKAGQGAQVSLGWVGMGRPIRCQGVSPGTPMGSSHPRWDPDRQSVEQPGPEPRSDLAPCRPELPALSRRSWAGQGAGAWCGGCRAGWGPPSAPCGVKRLLSFEGICYCSALEGLLSLSPREAGVRRLTQHPELLSHLHLRSSWAWSWGSTGGGWDARGPHAQHDLEESPPLWASLPHLSRGRWARPSSERKWRRAGGR